MTPEERIAQAEQAWMDAAADPDPFANCVTAALRSAITVKLTPEMLAQVALAADGFIVDKRRLAACATAAFRAAGFEVEQ